jgi:hypothetical protein
MSARIIFDCPHCSGPCEISLGGVATSRGHTVPTELPGPTFQSVEKYDHARQLCRN